MLRMLLVLFSLIVCTHTLAEDDNNQADPSSSLSNLTKQLPSTKLSKMAPLVDKIAATKTPYTKNLLQYLLDGELYYIRASKVIVRAQMNDAMTITRNKILVCIGHDHQPKICIKYVSG